jgi:general secretion pathway protein G
MRIFAVHYVVFEYIDLSKSVVKKTAVNKEKFVGGTFAVVAFYARIGRFSFCPDAPEWRGPTSLHHVIDRRSRQMAEANSRHGAARQGGFTLLELLVVVVIIGLLAAYVGPKYFSQLGKSEVTIAKAQIEAFEKSLDTYRLDVGRYPTTEEGLAALLVAPASGAARWNGPYLKKAVPPDPWGHPFQYRAPGAKGEFEIVSLGRDGQPGGSGDNADITN